MRTIYVLSLLIGLYLLPHPLSAQQPRKIYAHHMGGLPAGTSAIAWHTRNPELGDPATSNGGEFRNNALAPYHMNLSLDDAADLEIRRAMRIGVDGFAINAWASGQHAKDYLHALFRVAEAKNYPFEITICLDPVTIGSPSQDGPWGPEYQAQVEAIQYLLSHHGSSPKLARRGGKPLILGYQSIWLGLHYALRKTNWQYEWNDPALRSTAMGWHLMGEAYHELQRQVGSELYLHFDMAAFYHGTSWIGDNPFGDAAAVIAQYLPAVGEFLATDHTDRMAAAVRTTSAEWSQPVYFHYENSRNNAVMTAPGTDRLRYCWEQARETGSTLIQYTTWNDYNESTNLSPGYNTRYAHYDLTGYFIRWWKEGAAPVADRDRVYLFSRKYPREARVFPFQAPVYADGALEVTTLLTAPARVRLIGRGQEYDAPAGLFHKQFPVTPGPVSVEILRNGMVQQRLDHPEPITDRPFRQDNNPIGYSTEFFRHWTLDFGSEPPLIYSEYGDDDRDGLPNWFEMFWFGKLYDLSTATGVDPHADPDSDGQSNLTEYLAQTNPTSYNAPSSTAPTVALTSPLAGQTWPTGSPLLLEAIATSGSSTISSVEFFVGTTWLGKDTSLPYSFNWVNPTAGTHSLTARVNTGSGQSATSSPVALTIVTNTGGPVSEAGFTSSDIGTVSPAGYSSYDSVSGTFAVAGSGADIWDTSDAFHFVRKPASGDLEVVTRVTSISNTDLWAKAGIMVRGTTSSSSPHAMLVVTPDGAVSFQRRHTAGGMSFDTTAFNLKAPRWLKLVREGNVFTAYHSADGTMWSSAGSDTVNLPADVLVGLAVTSHSNGLLNLAQFDQYRQSGTTAAPVSSPVSTPPTVSLTAPADGDIFAAGSTLLLQATASSDAKDISSVEFYDGTTKLGADATSPYSYSWAGATSGEHLLTAKALTAAGLSAVSSAAKVTVLAAAPAGSPVSEAGFTAADIGSVSPAGYSSYDSTSGTLTVAGSGADIWDTQDAFHFVQQPLRGDAELVVRVADVALTNEWAKAGIMIRGSTDPAAAHAMVVLTPSGHVSFQRRRAAGAMTYDTTQFGFTVPRWLKLVRKGNDFSAFHSADGSTWTLVGSDTVTLPTDVLAGLAVTSHANGTLNVSHFDNYLLKRGEDNSASRDIGSTGVAGSSSFDAASGTYTLRGSGADIWGSEDAFHFHNKMLRGDAEIVTRVSSLQAANPWAKAGIMLRESLNSNSRHAMAVVTPANGVSFQWRAETAGPSLDITKPGPQAPRWLKLKRAGNDFSVFDSADGVSWNLLGTRSLSMPTDLYAGLVVTAHDNTVSATATMDRFSVQSGPYAHGDIGGVGMAGSTNYNESTGTFTLKGSGADIWGSQDGFHFMQRPIHLDGEIVVRVQSVENTDFWAKAGIMFRESLRPDARHAMVVVTPGGGVSFQRRLEPGGPSYDTTQFGLPAPRWLKLRRQSDKITAYHSADGVTWVFLGSQSVALPEYVHAGIAVTSHNNSVLATTVVDRVRIDDTLESRDVGATGYPGSFDSDASGKITLTGSGADIWGTADAFQFAYQTMDGNGTSYVRVGSVEAVNAWTKAGLMIRESLDPGSKHAMIVLTPSNGVAFQHRATTGGQTAHVGKPAATAPLWIALNREGDRFTGYFSADGVSWGYLGEAAIPMASRLYIGLVLTSHDNKRVATALFDHLEIEP